MKKREGDSKEPCRTSMVLGLRTEQGLSTITEKDWPKWHYDEGEVTKKLQLTPVIKLGYIWGTVQLQQKHNYNDCFLTWK